ncbi:MAG: hypothetical protein FJX80_16240, partial [Bacteroidetes bacterium]|nr:hypothetical protein [Bacteroidota bacterium]
PKENLSQEIAPSFSESIQSEEKVEEVEPVEPVKQEESLVKSESNTDEEIIELNKEEVESPMNGNTKTRKLRACKYGERLPNGKCPEKPKTKQPKIKQPDEKIIELNKEELESPMNGNTKTRKLRACKYGERLPNGKCPEKPKIKSNIRKKIDTDTLSENEFNINIEQRSHQGLGTLMGGESIGGESMGGESMGGESMGGESIGQEAIDQKSIDKEPIDEEYTGGENTSFSSSSSANKREIDPHQLTGKIGLERMMSFLDSKSPPVKGDFEYKQSTLKIYGKIFSQSEIGNYSAKIKCVLDKIYNPESKRVSDGIILIYSQYIDSGLIPVALALEEMGFTRFGQTGIKPLFKSRPTEVVDVRTMLPPQDKKDFKPARYAMITGDPRLSPNNDFEVKGLTGEDNIDGNKVKVVLISKAGSEGIDLKFIRQVHILDPWYNMNRPEQIIGRAVRNFSHKDLPFEKRNVEIFMHG